MASRLPVGSRAVLEHMFTSDDVAAFAGLSSDVNPIHLDPMAAKAAGFDGPVVHGVLVLGLISRLLGTRLPGPGTILLEQHIRYRKPVYPDRIVHAGVEITGAREDKPVYNLRTWVETDEVALEGEATVLVREIAHPT